ncbi:MAG TPA: hypothetical protein VHT26_16250 [Trebonia sp.]|nr:hypothetical protein [Trebonia sp.]
MKYAPLIYSPSTADEYGAYLDNARKAAAPEHGPWVDYTRTIIVAPVARWPTGPAPCR